MIAGDNLIIIKQQLQSAKKYWKQNVFPLGVNINKMEKCVNSVEKH